MTTQAKHKAPQVPSLKSLMQDYCTSDFPYVCTGDKTEREDGSWSCSCGKTTVSTQAYEDMIERKRQAA